MKQQMVVFQADTRIIHKLNGSGFYLELKEDDKPSEIMEEYHNGVKNGLTDGVNTMTEDASMLVDSETMEKQVNMINNPITTILELDNPTSKEEDDMPIILSEGEYWKLTISGVVQAGGFRPKITQLARKKNLCGFTWNVGGVVEVFFKATGEDVEEFIVVLKENTPKIIRIDDIQKVKGGKDDFKPDWEVAIKTEHEGRKKDEEMKKRDSILEGGFEPLSSDKEVDAPKLFPADTAICDECTDELFNNSDDNKLRKGYWFNNCTQCGPRYTILLKFPYKRDKTTMNGFTLCEDCHREFYNDDTSRRYYSEATCCRNCERPGLFYQDEPDGEITESDIAFQRANEALQEGYIIALKGIGGYHLMCRTDSKKNAERLLRELKDRDKPFAQMFRSIEEIEELCHVSPKEKELLQYPLNAIVLLRTRAEYMDSEGERIGAFLPYTPLHKLLLKENPRVIATSLNGKSEPIAFTDDEADAFLKESGERIGRLYNDRQIKRGIDDSVVQVVSWHDSKTDTTKDIVQIVRRARGYVPMTLKIDLGEKFLLAMGSDSKSTFAFYKDGHIFASPYKGDLDNDKIKKQYGMVIRDFQKLFFGDTNELDIIIADNDPKYHTASYAKSLASRIGNNIIVKSVYHHEAHVASVLAEHHDTLQDRRVLGVAFDEIGYGADKKNWGGEFLLWDEDVFTRVAHMEYVPLPGDSVGERDTIITVAHFLAHHGIEKDNEDSSCRETTSVGRMFDAVASLTDVCHYNLYEGECAITLQNVAEKYADSNNADPLKLKFDIEESDGTCILKHYNLFKELYDFRKDKSFDSGRAALGFHYALANAILEMAQKVRDTHDVHDIALSGGVFQNALLLKETFERLTKDKFNVYTNELYPVNDSGICIGQLYLAHFGK